MLKFWFLIDWLLHFSVKSSICSGLFAAHSSTILKYTSSSRSYPLLPCFIAYPLGVEKHYFDVKAQSCSPQRQCWTVGLSLVMRRQLAPGVWGQWKSAVGRGRIRTTGTRTTGTSVLLLDTRRFTNALTLLQVFLLPVPEPEQQTDQGLLPRMFFSWHRHNVHTVTSA